MITPPWPEQTDRAVCQRGWVHLSGEAYTASCVSIISFYGRVHVRFYDAGRRLIESLDADIMGWQRDEPHRLCCEWDDRQATLWLDGQVCDRRALDRPLGGAFSKLHVGCHPLHWTAEAVIERVTLSLQPASST